MCSISSIKQKKANKYAAFYYLCRKREKKMGQKEPIELALKLLDNLKIVRHNEHRYISSDFGFVNSFVKMETTLSHSVNRIVLKKDVSHSSSKALPEFSLI